MAEQCEIPPELVEKVQTLMHNIFPSKVTQDVSPPEQIQASPAEESTQGEVEEQRMDVEVETESSGVEGLYQGEDQQNEEDEDAKGETDIESSSLEKE